MRVYVHGGDPPLTLALRLDAWPDATVADAAARLAASHAARRGAPLDLSRAAFELAGGARVPGGSRVVDVVRDKGDIFVIQNGAGENAGDAPAAAGAQQPLACGPAIVASGGRSGGAQPAPAPGAPPAPAAALLVKQAEAAAARRGPRAAVELLRTALRASPGDFAALSALSRLLLSAGRAAEAVKHASAAAAARPGDAGAWQLLGDCQLAAGEPGAALGSFQRALALRCQEAGGEALLDLQMRVARALRATGTPSNARLAVALITSALAASGDDHFDALLLFSEAARGEGRPADAARVALRLLPRAPGDAAVKAALAAAIEVGGGAGAAPEPYAPRRCFDTWITPRLCAEPSMFNHHTRLFQARATAPLSTARRSTPRACRR